ncbi:MAG: HIT family protein [Bacteroidia bacterium]|nr:HIT family protein [Bacteroidia bacterium]MCC7532402.1 HIT family protein [Bacteroidia bacterium]MCZ2140553.1 HIT family protein [Bacteroidia bacterium]
MSTIFTKIVKGDIPCYKVAETADYLAFLDVRPVAVGHTLVIPKKEVDYIFDMDDEHFAGLHLFAKIVARAVKKVIPCKRIGVAVVGLEVPHTHIHLIPINTIGDINFEKERVQITPEQFEKIASDIRKELMHDKP